jgi:hypothetical protein
MASLTHQLALVSESTQAQMGDLMKVSAALQKQATRDLSSIWDIAATVDPFEKLEDVPIGYWPMIVMDDIGVAGAAGIHQDKDGQPFALISSASDLDSWSLTASHEALEMLVDPFGNRVMAGDSPQEGQGRVSFLVEVCDPSEAADFAYSSNGVLVSDFYTPNFFDPVVAPGVRYSFTGAVTEPRQVLRGGYLSWEDPVSSHWWQEVWFDAQPTFRDIGPLDQSAGSLRTQIDRLTNTETAKAIATGRKSAAAAGLTIATVHQSTSSKAAMWRAQIGEILGHKAIRTGTDAAIPMRRARRVR